MKKQFGLIRIPFVSANNEPINCADKLCDRKIHILSWCFLDDTGEIYCDDCGRCLRYERKMLQIRIDMGTEN